MLLCVALLAAPPPAVLQPTNASAVLAANEGRLRELALREAPNASGATLVATTPAAAEEEKRTDPADGKQYTKKEFQQEYGAKAEEKWLALAERA